MTRLFPLISKPASASPWIVSSAECVGLYSYEHYQPVGPYWVRPVLNDRKSAVLSISAAKYAHFVRDGAVFSAVQRPDGSVLSLERDVPGPLSCWEFVNGNAFLKRQGKQHGHAEVEWVTYVGSTLFGKRARPMQKNREELSELVIWREDRWEPLGVLGSNIAYLQAITDDTFWFNKGLYRWDGATLTHLSDAKISYCDNICAQVGNTTFVLNDRKLYTLEEDGTLAKTGWTVTNIMGIWSAGGLIFAVLGDNKRSWLAALYDPATGKTRGFKRRDFGLDRYQSSNQWLTAHGRLFFLSTTLHFEVDIAGICALRKTRLKS